MYSSGFVSCGGEWKPERGEEKDIWEVIVPHRGAQAA